MFVIRTAEEMARALDSPLDPELKRILAEHWARLADYDLPLSDLAQFVIAQPGDTLGDLEGHKAGRLFHVVSAGSSDTRSPEKVGQGGGAKLRVSFSILLNSHGSTKNFTSEVWLKGKPTF
jgi:hypothetical protein